MAFHRLRSITIFIVIALASGCATTPQRDYSPGARLAIDSDIFHSKASFDDEIEKLDKATKELNKTQGVDRMGLAIGSGLAQSAEIYRQTGSAVWSSSTINPTMLAFSLIPAAERKGAKYLYPVVMFEARKDDRDEDINEPAKKFVKAYFAAAKEISAKKGSPVVFGEYKFSESTSIPMGKNLYARFIHDEALEEKDYPWYNKRFLNLTEMDLSVDATERTPAYWVNESHGEFPDELIMPELSFTENAVAVQIASKEAPSMLVWLGSDLVKLRSGKGCEGMIFVQNGNVTTVPELMCSNPFDTKN